MKSAAAITATTTATMANKKRSINLRPNGEPYPSQYRLQQHQQRRQRAQSLPDHRGQARCLENDVDFESDGFVAEFKEEKQMTPQLFYHHIKFLTRAVCKGVFKMRHKL